MLKNRELRVRLARTNDTATSPIEETRPFLTADDITLIQNAAKRTGIFLAGMVVLYKATDAVAKIAIHHGTKS